MCLTGPVLLTLLQTEKEGRGGRVAYIHTSGLHKGGEANAIFIPSLETKLIFEIRNCRRQHPPPHTLSGYIPVPSSDDDVQPRPSLPNQSQALGQIKSGRYPGPGPGRARGGSYIIHKLK